MAGGDADAVSRVTAGGGRRCSRTRGSRRRPGTREAAFPALAVSRGPRALRLAWAMAVTFHGVGDPGLSQAPEGTGPRRGKDRGRQEGVREGSRTPGRRSKAEGCVVPAPGGGEKQAQIARHHPGTLVSTLLSEDPWPGRLHLRGMKTESQKCEAEASPKHSHGRPQDRLSVSTR